MAKEHHTKDKGDLGVFKAQCTCVEQGFTILLPLTEHAAYDFVIEKEGVFKRVQVKYRRKNKQGVLSIHFRSCWSDLHGIHFKPLEKKLVDVFAVYCPDTDQTYFFDPTDFGQHVSLRVDTPMNNQAKLVHFADDYLEVP